MTEFEKVSVIKRENRVVVSETDIALDTENGSEKKKAFGRTGNLHWYFLCVFIDLVLSKIPFRMLALSEYTLHIKPLNVGGIESRLAIFAFYVRNAADYKLVRLTEVSRC